MLTYSDRMTPVDRLFALASIQTAMAEILVVLENQDLKLSEIGRDGLGNLFSLLAEEISEAACAVADAAPELSKLEGGK